MIRNAFLTFPMNAHNFVQRWSMINTLAVLPIFFYVTLEMIAKGQRGTRSHSNMSFLQCAANGLVSFEAVRRFS